MDKKISQVIDDVTGIKDIRQAEAEEEEKKLEIEAEKEIITRKKAGKRGPKLKDYIIAFVTVFSILWYLGILGAGYSLVLEIMNAKEPLPEMTDAFMIIIPSAPPKLTVDGELTIKVTNNGISDTIVKEVEVWDIGSGLECTVDLKLPQKFREDADFILSSTDCNISGAKEGEGFELALQIKGETALDMQATAKKRIGKLGEEGSMGLGENDDDIPIEKRKIIQVVSSGRIKGVFT